MLSRIAEHLYWIGRFVERAEDISRLVTAHLYSSVQVSLIEEGPAHELLAALGAPDGSVRDAATWWVCGPENASSVVACIHASRSSARHAREVLSLETWEALNDASGSLDRMMQRSAGIEEIVAAVPAWTQRYSGIVESTALRDTTWAILRLGAMVERAAMTLRALTIGAESRTDWAHDDPLTLHTWTVTLRACGALDAYRKTTTALPSGRTTAQLLLRSVTCPRSVAWAIREAESLLPFGGEAARRVGEMRSDLESRPLDELFEDLSGTLQRLLDESDGIHEAIVGTWQGREEAG